MNETRRLIIGGSLALFAGLCFSSGGFFVRSLPIDQWEIVFFRCLFAGLGILIYLIFTERRNTVKTILKAGWPGLLIGLVTAWAIIAYVLAMQTTLVANVLALMATATIIVPILSGPLLGERVPLSTWIAVIFGITGILLMVFEAAGTGQLVGNILAFTIALAIAAQTLIARRFKSSSMIPSVLIGATLAGIVSLPLALPIEATIKDVFILAAFGITTLAIALILYFTAARFLPAPTLILVVLIDAVLAPIWVWIGFGELPNLFTFIGAAIILAGVTYNSSFAILKLSFRSK